MEEGITKAIKNLVGIFCGEPEDQEIYDFICGEDFCEDCGDCLSCDGDMPCSISSNQKHTVSPELLEKRKRKR